jgi:hypothetical protein
MSRASTLARAIGADGALNVADVAGLAAVASSGSASDLSTGTLPIARIADGAVVNAKLGTDLDASKLTAGTLPIARIADGAVTDGKIAGMVASKLTGRIPKTVSNTDHFYRELGWTAGYNNDYSNMPYANRVINLEPSNVPANGDGGSYCWGRILYVCVKNNGENPYFSWHILFAQAKVAYSGGFFSYASLELVAPVAALSSQVSRLSVALDGITYELRFNGSSGNDTTPNDNSSFMPQLYVAGGGYRAYTRVFVYDWLDYYKGYALNNDF